MFAMTAQVLYSNRLHLTLKWYLCGYRNVEAARGVKI